MTSMIVICIFMLRFADCDYSPQIHDASPDQERNPRHEGRNCTQQDRVSTSPASRDRGRTCSRLQGQVRLGENRGEWCGNHLHPILPLPAARQKGYRRYRAHTREKVWLTSEKSEARGVRSSP